MLDQIDVLFMAWLGFSVISLVYLHKRNQKQAVKVKTDKAQDKMREDFEKFLDGSQK